MSFSEVIILFKRSQEKKLILFKRFNDLLQVASLSVFQTFFIYEDDSFFKKFGAEKRFESLKSHFRVKRDTEVSGNSTMRRSSTFSEIGSLVTHSGSSSTLLSERFLAWSSYSSLVEGPVSSLPVKLPVIEESIMDNVSSQELVEELRVQLF